jgi:hypothetical protein
LLQLQFRFFFMASASVWEGVAAIGEDLPDKGPYLATNSFPVNTIVEVVNLEENNRAATMIVSAALENSKLLALLSKDAAVAIGLNDIGRIRMIEKDDQISYSGIGEQIVFWDDFNYTSDLDGYNLTFETADLRPPQDENFWEPDPASFIPQIPKVTESPVVAAIPEQLPPPPVAESATTPRFSVPMIENFDKGSYYVQIGAYEKTQTVESEILKVKENLPMAVMKTVAKIGNVERLVYRILIGPLNLGESKTVLQKYKAIYKDAFLWIGT